MKISINANIIDGPWGGGNQAVKSIYNYLVGGGHDVITDLKASDIDLILMIHPSRYLKVRGYGIEEIRNYIALHPNTVLVHRVNTSDERRGTKGENEIILEANKLADYTVFISSYISKFYISKGFDSKRPNSVFLNGADEMIFTPDGRVDWNHRDKLKIITHHWSDNYMKGFDVYERLDQLLGTEPFCNLFEFTVIGNIPTGLIFKYTKIIQPLAGTELAQAIRQHHIYLTATRNEPAGMHHIEGMRCGLPVLFLNSGALPEYCSPYGIEFTLINFEQKLLEMRDRYLEMREKVLSCPYRGTWMAKQYMTLFEELVNKRRENPLPKPGLERILKQRLVGNTFLKVKRFGELMKKAKKHL